MAKDERRRTQPPRPGGKKVERAGQFHNFEGEGDTIEGILIGTTQIKSNLRDEMVDRWVIQVRSGEQKILPDHYNLNAYLEQITLGKFVWIAYEGKEAVRGARQPMAQYNVVWWDEPPTDWPGEAAPAQTVTHTTGEQPAPAPGPAPSPAPAPKKADTGVKPGGEADTAVVIGGKAAAGMKTNAKVTSNANETLTDAERTELIEYSRGHGLIDDMLKNILHMVTGKPTTKGLTKAQRIQVEAAIVAKADEMAAASKPDDEEVSF